MPRFVNMKLYHRYKNDILKLTNARQRYKPGHARRGLSDKEIAERLGLSTEAVVEIRCIAENDMIPLESYLDAEGVKEKRYRRLPGKK